MAIGIVVRKSTRDEQHVSNNRQEKLGREWAALNHPGADVLVFADNKVSGIDMARDGWTSFTNAVRGGRVETVWCYEQSRLTRAGLATWDDVVVMLTVAGILEVNTYRQGTISVREGNRLQGRLLAVLDQEEREVAKVRVRDAHEVLAREGRPSGGRVFGYQIGFDGEGRKTRLVVPAEAEVIREAARRLLAGEPMMRIADDFRERGVATARGGQWKVQNVRSIVSNPTVAALRDHNGVVVPGRWAAILDRETWDRVRAYLADTRTVIDRTGQARKVVHPLRNGRRYLMTGGLARCGKCGHPLVAQTRTFRGNGRQPAYTCRPDTVAGSCGGVSIGAEPLEAWVVSHLFKLAADGGLDRRLDDDGTRARLITELAEAEARQRTLAEDFGAGLLPETAYRDGLTLAAKRSARIRADLEVLGPADVAELDHPHRLAELWDDLTLARRRTVLAAALASVTVFPARSGTRRFDAGRVAIA